MATYTGTSAANHIIGTGAADIIRGYGGNDLLEGLGGSDRIYGGGGADTINGGKGNDLLSGGAGNDTFLYAISDGRDVVTDFAAGDLVRISGYASAQSLAQVGGDVVLTLSASDTITFSNATATTVQAALQFGSGGGSGGGPTGTITGTSGNDMLNGTGSNDTINGLGGDDIIKGGAGDDRIIGGLGSDTLSGGGGSDTFAYLSLAELSKTYGAEMIYDWSAEDRIDLSAIDANALVAGNQAFVFAGYSFGHPPTVTTPGTLTIGGFGGELWILGYTDNVDGPDLMINLWSAAGEGALTVNNLIL
ncbi:calcium-binding protein [Sphingomonas sp. URHD0057]|uniref:calcium-binding protein n=1 Tax=Sphingomonas sp. URHD0057 TaxID=1380389 RepID=UPI00048D4BB9|nr:hypothetical protein [Sphingomonas sp. URHD0057]